MGSRHGRCAAIVTAVSLAFGLTGCWEQARFDAAHSNWNSGESTITSANVADLVDLWSHDLGEGRVVAPLSRGDTIYVVADEDNAASGFAFDAQTGTVRWTNTVPGAGVDFWVAEPVYRDSQLVVPFGAGRFGGTRSYDPATGNEVATAGNNNTWALAVAGAELATGTLSHSSSIPVFWGYSIGWRCNAGHSGQGGSPGVLTDMAFVGDSLMWAFQGQAEGYVGCPEGATTWTSTWTTPLGGEAVSVVGVGTTHVAYLDDTGTLTVLDATTGAVAWPALEVGVGSSTPAVADGKVVVRTGDGRVLALDALTGTALWESAAGSADGAPLVGGDVVYVPAGNGFVTFALDGCGAATCASLSTIDVGSDVTDSSIVDDGRLIATTAAGRVVAFGLPS